MALLYLRERGFKSSENMSCQMKINLCLKIKKKKNKIGNQEFLLHKEEQAKPKHGPKSIIFNKKHSKNNTNFQSSK